MQAVCLLGIGGREPSLTHTHTHDKLFPPEDAEPTMRIKRAVLEEGDRVTDEFSFHKPWGDRYYIAAGEPIRRAGDDEIQGVSFAAIDITETQQLREETRALRRQNERLEEFSSIISHDLRNPLSVAKGHIELAREEDDSEHLETAEEALGRMEALIEDLLTLAKKGKHIEDTEAVSLAAVATNAWEMTNTQDGIIEIDVESTIRADGDRLGELFENLFRNAIVHVGGDVEVRVGGLSDGFYVEDDGEGIPTDERDEVFETGHSTRPGGTGFGLKIVESIAHAHVWDVSVTDGTDGGARFEFTNATTLD